MEIEEEVQLLVNQDLLTIIINLDLPEQLVMTLRGLFVKSVGHFFYETRPIIQKTGTHKDLMQCDHGMF